MDAQFMMKVGREKGRRALKPKLSVKIMQISEQTVMGNKVFEIKLPSDLYL